MCREPGNAWALQKAKDNLVNNYLVVGVTERLTEFVAVMEVVLPRFFKGATKRFILGMYCLRKCVKTIANSTAFFYFQESVGGY